MYPASWVEFKPESLVPGEQANMKFVYSQTELTQACQQVCAHSACPAKCHTTGPGKVAMVGERATATLHAMDQEGRECRDPVEVTCELVSSDGSSRVRGEVRRNGESKYEISYCPQHRGRHQFTVTPIGIGVHPHSSKIYIAEQSIYRIQILNPDFTFCSSFGSPGTGNAEFKYPFGISFDSTGNVFVSEWGNNRKQVFTDKVWNSH